MQNWLTQLLTCPHCAGNIDLEMTPVETAGEEIITGKLLCPSCKREYDITNGIPRFVAQDENYAENFGDQWNRFRITQIDRLAGHTLSGTRLLSDTRWSGEWMKGKLILDAGCGAGRFADELAQRGARVVAFDLSSAVESCKETIGDPTGYSGERGEVAVVQANLLMLPFKSGIFDAVHCAGVIQHTPDPAKVMGALPASLKSGGRLFYNFYEIDPLTRFQVIKYLLRHWTPHWRTQNLLVFCRTLCRMFFVLSWIMSRIPKVRFFNAFLPINAVHPPGMPLKQQFAHTLLDTVDWYGPVYEIRQNHKEVAALLEAAELDQVEADAGRVWAVKK